MLRRLSTLVFLLVIMCACVPASTPTNIPVHCPRQQAYPVQQKTRDEPDGKIFRVSSAPFTGVASPRFVVAEIKDDGTRGLFIDETETKAYIIGEFSGQLRRLIIDSTSPTFGKTTLLADKLFILNDIAVNRAGSCAYVTRESGPGQTRLDRT